MKNSPNHLGFLDCLRGIAILAVLIFHSYLLVCQTAEAPWHGWFRDFSDSPFSLALLYPLNFGQAGVAIFFVVSGFCIHLSFHQQGRVWGGFFIRRIFRIYPAYLAALVFSTMLGCCFHFREMVGYWDFWRQFLTHLFLVHNFEAGTMAGINGVFWSLAIEFQLYLFYPVLLVLVAKLGWRRALILLAACEFTIRGFGGFMNATTDGTGLASQISVFFCNSVLCYLFSWSLGAWVADGFLKNKPRPALNHSPYWWVALAASCYMVKPFTLFLFPFSAIATAILISQLLDGASSGIKFPSLPLELLRKLGLWSYSIYLIHLPLLYAYKNAIEAVVPSAYRSKPAEVLLLSFTWTAIIILSVLWYKIFETPGIALGKRIIKKISGRAGAEVTPVNLTPNQQALMAKGRYGLLVGMTLALVIGNYAVQREFFPADPVGNNNQAWILATSYDAKNRNGPLAVELAKDACRQTQYRVTVMVGTLAAAYAEAGEFNEAILAAQKACAMAAEDGETNLLGKNQELLELYQAHRPYHQSEQPAQPTP